ncbi:MAG: hypothetical protein ACOYJG_04450 [Prevotella sp.]|jgi:hypothetical protein
MKKIFSTLIVLAAAAMSFTSCEDVPSPYDYPERNGDTVEVIDNDSVYIYATFASEFTPFTVVTPQGTAWTIDSHKYAKGTGYADGSTTASNSYLVSTPVDLTESNSAYVQFEYMLRYYTNYGQAKDGVVDRVLITDNYTGDPTTTTWTELLTGDNMTEGSDWNTWYTAAVQLPSEFIGKNNIVVALNYACTDNSATWEVRNFILHEGTAPTIDTGGESTGEAKGDGTEANPYNSVAANAQALAGNTSEVYVTGKISEISEVSTDYGNATYFISDDGTSTDQFEIFRGYYLNGEKFTSEDQIQVGQTVVVKGKLSVYGSTPELAQGSQIISINGEGGTTGGDTTETGGIGTVSGNTISFSATDCGLDNASEIGTLVLTDGTKLTFEAGTSSNTPKFYTTGSGTLRVYPGNTITVTSTKTISSITFTCDSYNGTDYTAQGNVSVNPGTFSLDGLTMNFTDINATSTVITNTNTGTGGKTQIRITNIVITYAE